MHAMVNRNSSQVIYFHLFSYNFYVFGLQLTKKKGEKDFCLQRNTLYDTD